MAENCHLRKGLPRLEPGFSLGLDALAIPVVFPRQVIHRPGDRTWVRMEEACTVTNLGNGKEGIVRRQLFLFDSRVEDDGTRKYLGSYRPRNPVEIVFTRNRSTILSVRVKGATRVLRIQEVFRDAPQPVWDAVVSLYLRGVVRSKRRELHRVINEFMQGVRDVMTRSKPETLRLDRLSGPVGKVFHLDQILEDVRSAAIPEEVNVFLTWSDRTNRRTMGSWHQTPAEYPNVVRVNRLLDDVRVPRLYVASVVHHELLHEVLGYEECGGRRVHHTKAFRDRERSFPGYELAEEWAETQLSRIYRSRVQKERRAKALTRPSGSLACSSPGQGTR